MPVVLVGDILVGKDAANTEREPIASHAVTVTGYNVTAAPADDRDALRSDRIDKLYVHDDAVGPFARMAFQEGDVSMLSTSLAETKDRIGKRWFRPTMVLVPLYHKIRIPFGRILADVSTLARFIRALRTSGQPGTEPCPRASGTSGSPP